jgi:hypothetical protein
MSLRILFVLALLAVSGTTMAKKPPPLFVPSADQSLPAPPADKAQIVFLEPINSIQGLFPVGLYEVDGENHVLIAITGAHSKAAVLVAPGHHVFMANQSAMIAHFLDANVEAGKRYYVLVRFIYAHGFQLRPIRPSGPSDFTVANKDYASWNATTHFVEKTGDGDAFFEKYDDKIVKTQAVGWTDWLAKTPEERAELTLNPQDVISP